MFTNSEKFAKELIKAGKDCGELMFKMPLLAENKSNMKGNHGDLNNKSKVTYSLLFSNKFIDIFKGLLVLLMLQVSWNSLLKKV